MPGSLSIWLESRRPPLTVVIVAALAVLAYLAVYTHYYNPHVTPPIRSDGVGYYSYLPAYLLERDPTFHTYVSKDMHGMPVEAAGLRLDQETGNYLNQYSIGEAVMLTPFFAVGHVAALITGRRADGFSSLEQAAVGLGGLVYMVLGIWLLSITLRRYFSYGVTAATVVVIVFGTNLFHYATADSTFSHAFSFLLVALLVELTHRWYSRPGLMTSIQLGLTVGLIVLVRQSNVVFLLLVPLFGMASRGAVVERLAFVRANLRGIYLVAGASVGIVLPQLLVWHIATGHWITYSYGQNHFNFRSPHLLEVLFSFNPHGVFPWSPALLLAVVGLPVIWRRARPMLVPTIVIGFLLYYTIASWPFWWYAGGYGHRGFIDLYPLLAFGLASLFASFATWSGRIIITAFAGVACLLATVQMIHYWQQLIPIDGASLRGYLAVLPHPLW